MDSDVIKVDTDDIRVKAKPAIEDSKKSLSDASTYMSKITVPKDFCYWSKFNNIKSEISNISNQLGKISNELINIAEKFEDTEKRPGNFLEFATDVISGLFTLDVYGAEKDSFTPLTKTYTSTGEGTGITTFSNGMVIENKKTEEGSIETIKYAGGDKIVYYRDINNNLERTECIWKNGDIGITEFKDLNMSQHTKIYHDGGISKSERNGNVEIFSSNRHGIIREAIIPLTPSEKYPEIMHRTEYFPIGSVETIRDEETGTIINTKRTEEGYTTIFKYQNQYTREEFMDNRWYSGRKSYC